MFFFIALEKACQVQLLADAAAAGRGISPVKISPDEAAATVQTNGNLRAGWFQGLPEFEALEAAEGKKFELISPSHDAVHSVNMLNLSRSHV